MAWLAAAPEALAVERSVLARSPAPGHAPCFPWTRTPDGEAERLWNWCVARSGARSGSRGVVKIAIVGTGVSGLVAAHVLHRDHDITVFEADGRVGGHANTVDVEVDGISARGRHRIHRLQRAQLPGVPAPARATWRRDPADGDELQRHRRRERARVPGLESQHDVRAAAQPAATLVPASARRHRAVQPGRAPARRRTRRAGTGADRLPASRRRRRPTDDESIESFLRRGRYSRSFVDQFLVPFGASIWSADPATFTRFPMRSYARFMHNHGLLGASGPPAVAHDHAAGLADTSTRSSRRSPIASGSAPRCTRSSAHRPPAAATVEVLTDRGPERFDRVIIAAHSDQALEMLADPSPSERSVLGAIRYQPNTATLHTDARMLPTQPAGPRQLELPDRSRRSSRDRHVLDERAPGDRPLDGRSSSR